MKPSSILLLAAAGLSSAMPARPLPKDAAVLKARDARSLFGHAVHALGARGLVPLNANTAAPPPAVEPAVMQEVPTPTTGNKADDAAAATATEVAATTEAVATEAATTTTAAAAATTTTEAATATEAVTTTAAPALETGAVAIGNGTAGDNGKGNGKGKGNGNNNGKGKGGSGRNNNNGNKNKGNNNNNNSNGLGAFISGALSQLGLDGVLDAGAIDKLSAGDQISLLAQVVSLQTMKDLQMVGGKDIVVVLNQGFKSSGLNVVINA